MVTNSYLPSGYNLSLGGSPSQPMSPQVAAQFSAARAQNTAVTPGQPQNSGQKGSGLGLSDLSNVTKFGNIGSAIDAWGVNNLGIGSVQYSGIGPGTLPWNQPGMSAPNFMAGEAGTSVTGGISGILGGAGFGAGIGGLIGDWVGGNPMGSTIGGALGGALGAATGISSGMAMGATLGSVVPGLGTVIGAIGGSLLGGMFGGGGTPHPWSMFKGGTLGADGSIQNAALTNKHINKKFGQSTQDTFSKYMQDQAQKYGITYKEGLAVYGGYRDKTGQVGISSDPDFWSSKLYHTPEKSQSDTYKQFNFDPKDKAARTKAYEDAWKYAIAQSGIDIGTLKEINPSAVNVTVPKVDGLKQWQDYLANYKNEQGV